MPSSLRYFQDKYPVSGQRVMIDATSVVIGDVILGDDVSIWPLVVIRGDVNQITLGCRTNIQDGAVLHVTHKSASHPHGHPLILGNDVTIGHKVILHGCTIEDRVLVGMGSIVMDGVIIESNVMVGAGSLIPPGKHLKTGYLYLGNPVKQIRALTEEEHRYLTYSADNYVRWKNNYLDQESQKTP